MNQTAHSHEFSPGEYHAFNEYCANHMMLAMHAVKDVGDVKKGQHIGDAVAKRHDCAAGWRYVLYTNRHRSRKVMRALELVYS